MRIYAEKPLRAVLQVLVDLLAVVWVVAAVQVATGTQHLVLQWKAPGQQIIDAGTQLRNTFLSASSTASGIPFVGNDFAGVLGQGTVSGDVLGQVGRGEMQAVEYLSGGVAVTIVVVALIPVLSVWLPRRLRYARRATRAVSMRAHAPDLLALRALNELPYRRLKRVAADPSAAWRGEDRGAIAQLANLQLTRHGLRPLRSAPDEQVDAGAATPGEAARQSETATLPSGATSGTTAAPAGTVGLPAETAELPKASRTTTAELRKDSDAGADTATGTSSASAGAASTGGASGSDPADRSGAEPSTADHRADPADER